MYFRVIFVTKSMTEGKPLKLILQFAVPLLFGNLLQQMYNLVDAAIVGRVLGTGALAAVGATSSVQFLVLGAHHGGMFSVLHAHFTNALRAAGCF